jgi:hypothetical protein
VIALRQATEKGIGEVGTKEKEVETADESAVYKCLVAATKYPHHFDKGRQPGEGRAVP